MQRDAIISQQLAAAQQHRRDGQVDHAMAVYAGLMQLAPERIEPYLGSGDICLEDGRFDEALYWFERARDVSRDAPMAIEGQGNALLALGRAAEALAVFERLQTLAPKSSIAFHGAGEALMQLGRLKEARRALEQAAILAPDNAGHHYALAQIGRFTENDARLAGLERLAEKAETLQERDRCELHFALAKARDELGRHEEAFEQWRLGNAIRRKYVGYNEAMFLGILNDLAAAFTPEVVAARHGAGDPSEIAVFVIGMPRSGTSLVEQILASHPDVFGAGEKMYLHYLLGQNLLGPDFPAHFAEVPNAALRQLGSLYATRLKADAPSARRIVDKLPANFMLAGLIHLALPKARIIHVRRDPLDTCFSCYTNLFTQNIDYSYDLGELGRYYRAYDRLMAHWRCVLPASAMLEVSYEALVGDLEGEARRIVDYCGLDWNAACLSFWKTDRVVHTLSGAQVRQPVYTGSIGRAAAYARWLGPLRDALG